MNNEQEVDYLNKFPAILQAKLRNGEIAFPLETQFDYDPILAYRGIIRNTNDTATINESDMLSHYEMKKIPRGIANYESDPKYYAISLFETLDMLKECWKFPKPNKKIAQGYVHKEGGPQYTDSRKHISWWLYEDADISSFVIKDDIDG